MKHKINLTILLLLIYQFVAVIVNQSVIIPYPLDVMTRMLSMLTDISFYQTIFITLSHVAIVIVISVILSFFLAFLCYKKPIIEEYVSPILSMIQAIPNVSFVIIVLVWTSSLMTVYIVLFLVIFPLLFHNNLAGFKSIDKELCDVISLYHPPIYDRFMNVYLPLIKPSFLSGLKSSISLGVKVSVMAEVLAGLPYGVGKAIMYCRNDFDMAGVFAWTLWLIIMILLIDYILKRLIHSE
ncbi:MAG: ABC transporter permease subunit [Coprobacillus sp.]